MDSKLYSSLVIPDNIKGNQHGDFKRAVQLWRKANQKMCVEIMSQG
jgi:hypothetical protein